MFYDYNLGNKNIEVQLKIYKYEILYIFSSIFTQQSIIS